MTSLDTLHRNDRQALIQGLAIYMAEQINAIHPGAVYLGGAAPSDVQHSATSFGFSSYVTWGIAYTVKDGGRTRRFTRGAKARISDHSTGTSRLIHEDHVEPTKEAVDAYVAKVAEWIEEVR